MPQTLKAYQALGFTQKEAVGAFVSHEFGLQRGVLPKDTKKFYARLEEVALDPTLLDAAVSFYKDRHREASDRISSAAGKGR